MGQDDARPWRAGHLSQPGPGRGRLGRQDAGAHADPCRAAPGLGRRPVRLVHLAAAPLHRPGQPVADPGLRRAWRDRAAGGAVQAQGRQPVRHRLRLRRRLRRLRRFPVEYGTLLVPALVGPGGCQGSRRRRAQGRGAAPGRDSARHPPAGHAFAGARHPGQARRAALGRGGPGHRNPPGRSAGHANGQRGRGLRGRRSGGRGERSGPGGRDGGGSGRPGPSRSCSHRSGRPGRRRRAFRPVAPGRAAGLDFS
nr:hypothetical protein [Pseudoduganella violacea]